MLVENTSVPPGMYSGGRVLMPVEDKRDPPGKLVDKDGKYKE